MNMPNKSYQIQEDAPLIVSEPAVAYQRTAPSEYSLTGGDYELAGKINPNVPFHGTQEELWDHIHRIEAGPFYPVAETHQRISQWLQSLQIQ